MRIDNKDKILPYLVFGRNTFYFVQCIQRRKENPLLEKDSYQRGYWFITSLQEFQLHLSRMRSMTEHFNARVYISMCPRSLEKLTKYCIVEMGKRVISENYALSFSIPQKLALSKNVLEKGIRPKPIWIIDIDSRENEYRDNIIRYLKEIGVEILDTLDTLNGYHLLVNAFNIGLLKTLRVTTKRNDYKIKSGEIFTILPEGNTVLFIN